MAHAGRVMLCCPTLPPPEVIGGFFSDLCGSQFRDGYKFSKFSKSFCKFTKLTLDRGLVRRVS